MATYNFSNLSISLNISSNGVSDDLRIVELILALVIAVIGIIGNTLTIFQIINKRLYRQVCNLYILNLSINNLFTSSITTPVLGVSFYKQEWIFGEIFCYVFPYLVHTTTCAETNALLLITINRYLIVVRPLLYNKLYKKKYFNTILIGSSWLIYMLIQILPLAKIWGKFEYNRYKHYCTYGADSETKTFIASLCAMILLTNLPIHMYCYGSILWKYKKSKKRVSLTQSCSQQSKTQKYTNEPKPNMSLVKMVIVILTCFVLTHAPFLGVNAIDPTLKSTGITVYTVVTYIALSHTAINPIVYALMNKQIYSNKCRSPFFC